MNDFENIKNQWLLTETPAPKNNSEEIIKKSNYINRKQKITKLVLGITIIILIGFFFYISAYKYSQTFLGLGLMLACLSIRMGIEYASGIKKENFASYQSMKAFDNQLLRYYKSRKKIHYIWTPILFGIYVIGFLLLLPGFKESLSSGFYTYIIVSAVLTFVALLLLIAFQIKKELKIIKNLEQMHS
ncbi:hypothetical protein [Zunongwangia sp. HGR-M22]|uniref:hypothetical protein n=1 Tax=Zunongwangia sp. HGR-M22 TaxID=3015168 RepID=UPI0022DDC803|nr:hypothetical protein [Zunongwangia sp. HGR-M22]WBL24897.1 hypothetical protein PBT91_13420 [Zunongwangia sp. HGR-M22]